MWTLYQAQNKFTAAIGHSRTPFLAYKSTTSASGVREQSNGSMRDTQQLFQSGHSSRHLKACSSEVRVQDCEMGYN